MVGKKILYKEKARRVLIHGMEIMVEAVSVLELCASLPDPAGHAVGR